MPAERADVSATSKTGEAVNAGSRSSVNGIDLSGDFPPSDAVDNRNIVSLVA